MHKPKVNSYDNRNNNLSLEPKIVRIIAIFAVIAMIASFVAALSNFTGKNEVPISTEPEVAESVNVSEQVTTETSEPITNTPEKTYQYYDKLNFTDKQVDNSEVTNGSLSIVKNDSSAFPIVNQSELKSIYAMKSDVYGLSGNGLYLYEEAITGLDAFIVSFYNEVSDNGLIIDKAYLPYNEADPANGTIDLSSGYSVRFSIYGSSYAFSDPEFNYLKEQAYRYGVIQRYPEGKKSHTGYDANSTIYRYVGMAHSWYMNYYKISLEEYIDTLRTNKIIEFKCGTENNKAYVIYYVEAEENSISTTVPVPSDEYKYTISGDGSRGFIVSVEVPVA